MPIPVIYLAVKRQTMKFYNWEKEPGLLENIEARSKRTTQMTFAVGRRRIGKTSLLVKTNEAKSMVYFFVVKKKEALLYQEFVEKSVIFGEVKRKKENISIAGLKDKAKNLQAQLQNHHAEFIGFSLEDI